jgi:hypothetical protein
MPEPTLDWSTAEVKDSKLTVQVDGDLPDGWEDTFNTTVQLLGGGSWGEIKLEEQKAEVTGLRPGDEAKLKHFLESVVQQANATHLGDEDEEQGEDEDDEQDGEDDEDSEQESDEDKEMSKRFQSFAEEDSEEDSDEDDDSDDKDSKSDDKGSQKDDSDDDSSE